MSKLIEGFENYSIDRQGNVFNHIRGAMWMNYSKSRQISIYRGVY